MLKFILLTLISISVYAELPLVKIAVIDTGLDVTKLGNIRLCDSGHYNFQSNIEGIGPDFDGHGTNIARTIADNVGQINYCLIIIKYNYSIGTDKDVKSLSISNAVSQALNAGVDIINFSSSGQGFILEEYNAFKRASYLGVKIVAAAGNDGFNLTIKNCKAFPACYTDIPNLIIVGNLKDKNNLNKTSNYGIFVDQYEIGKSCSSGVCMEGTSQATALYTSRLAKTIFNIKMVTKPVKSKKRKR